MKFTVETEQEQDGRWLAEVKELPGVPVYRKDSHDAPPLKPWRWRYVSLRIVLKMAKAHAQGGQSNRAEA